MTQTSAPNDWIVRASDIRFQYPDGLVAIDQLNIEVRAGEVLSIVGPSGCGKSTLLSILAGLRTPTSGEVGWNEPLDWPIRMLDGKPVRRRLGSSSNETLCSRGSRSNRP